MGPPEAQAGSRCAVRPLSSAAAAPSPPTRASGSVPRASRGERGNVLRGRPRRRAARASRARGVDSSATRRLPPIAGRGARAPGASPARAPLSLPRAGTPRPLRCGASRRNRAIGRRAFEDRRRRRRSPRQVESSQSARARRRCPRGNARLSEGDPPSAPSPVRGATPSGRCRADRARDRASAGCEGRTARRPANPRARSRRRASLQ